jgi:L-alanine-DL-glutamate epimerase-like enolase superfamily enzyme
MQSIPLPAFSPLHLAKVEAMVLRVPISVPVQTSFGIMHDRPAVLVRIEDKEGAVGWGEIWCNFPAVGAEHRARLLESAVAPILLSREWARPEDAFAALSEALRVLAIQTGEPGPIAHAIAGADIALWDLLGKRLQKPLWQLLGGSREIGTYASGLSPTDPEDLAAQKLAEGYRAFKLKVGFGEERDLANLRALRHLLGDETPLMVDANQAWTVEEAARMSVKLAEFKLGWLEEPITADHALADWQALAACSPLTLAGGIIQPDLGKWGGFSGCVPVGRQALQAGRMFCPHWLGGGIGLVASMHLKAAVGGAGYVEVDSNPNPLRDMLARPMPQVQEGRITLSDAPGLGVEPDLEAVKQYLRQHRY